MATAIKFGTSGWRAIVADEFTVANIRLATAGIAAYVKTQPAPHRVLVGRDPRFLGESFVAEAARVLVAGLDGESLGDGLYGYYVYRAFWYALASFVVLALVHGRLRTSSLAHACITVAAQRDARRGDRHATISFLRPHRRFASCRCTNTNV